MAIVINNYINNKGMGVRAKAKKSIRYIAHRPGKDHTQMSRTLFGSDGHMERHEAERLIDEAQKGSIFFRFIISPDAKTEDTRRDLPLRTITQQTMDTLSDQIHKPVSWVAAIHADHAPHRHVHIVAIIPGRLPPQAFNALPHFLRQTATQACQEERQERDLSLGQQEREREETQWEQQR